MFGQTQEAAHAADRDAADRVDSVPVTRLVAWQRAHVATLVAADVIAVWLAATVTRLLGLDFDSSQSVLAYSAVTALLVVGWLAALALTGSYEVGRGCSPAEEFGRILQGTGLALGTFAVGALVSRVTVARGALLADLGLGLGAIGIGRLTVRTMVIARRRAGAWTVDGLPLAWIDHREHSGPRRPLKRAVDILAALFGLTVAAPLMLVIAAMIKITSPGKVIFKQVRLGKDGLPIRVWKFRTMVADAEQRQADILELNESGNLLYFKIREDPRITRVGKVLRRWSLDELPQFINVLMGSMSLVGPRPLPGEIDQCEDDYRRRLRVKPGLTGLWQVSGRSTLSADEALRLDLYYVENWSFGLDLAIILRTAWAVVRSSGAY